MLQRVGRFWKRFKSVTCLQIRSKNMRCESALQVDQCNITFTPVRPLTWARIDVALSFLRRWSEFRAIFPAVSRRGVCARATPFPLASSAFLGTLTPVSPVSISAIHWGYMEKDEKVEITKVHHLIPSSNRISISGRIIFSCEFPSRLNLYFF